MTVTRHRPNTFAAHFIALLLLLGIGLPYRADAQAPETPQIVKEIQFNGFLNVTPDVQAQTRAVVKSKVDQPYNKTTAENDVNEILGLGWYFRASENPEPVEGGIRLIFNLVENPVVTGVSFTGNTQISAADLLKAIQTKPGTVLNKNLVGQDASRIKDEYAKRGFTLTTVADIQISKEGGLQFVIFEPKIGEIRIEGNQKTHENIIRRYLTFKPGDVYNEKDVRNSLQRLEHLNIFKEVTALPEPGTEPGTLIIDVRVTEQRTGLASLGAGSSNIKGLFVFVNVSDSNIFGTGQNVSAQVQVGADRSYEVGYTNPWVDNKQTSFSANLYDKTILRQAVQGTITYLYDERRTGGNVSVGRPLQPDKTGFSNTMAYITLRSDRVGAQQDTSTTYTPPPSLLSDSTVHSIALSLVKDTRMNILNPSGGSYLSFATEFAGLGGAPFDKYTGDFRHYWTVYRPKVRPVAEGAEKKPAPQPWVYASRVMVGTITGAPPFLDQYLTGGAETLRGYKEDRYPGQQMVLWNNELRIPIMESLQFVTFTDIGDAWGGPFARGFGDPDFVLHEGAGVGIRVLTPIGPLRLDYGISREGEKEFHFGVGSTF